MRKHLTFAAVVLLSLIVPSLKAAEGNAIKPVGSVNLDGAYQEYARSGEPIEQVQLVYLAADKLALSFRVFLKPPDEELSLVCIVLDAATLRAERTLVWKTPYTDLQHWPGHRWILPAVGGEFLVVTGAKLLRYSADFQLLQERPIEDPYKTSVELSPDRRLLLIEDFVRASVSRETIVTTADLTNARVFDEGTRVESIGNDGSVLRLKFTRMVEGFPACTTPLGDWNSPTRKTTCGSFPIPGGRKVYLCTTASSCRIISSDPSPGPVFVNSNLIFEPSNLQDFVLRSLTVTIVYRGTYSDVKGEGGGIPISEDALSQRFSFMSIYLLLSPPPAAGMTTTRRVHVFDLRAIKPIGTLTFLGEGNNPFRSFDQAISPDGSRLAVLRDHDLDLYILP